MHPSTNFLRDWSSPKSFHIIFIYEIIIVFDSNFTAIFCKGSDEQHGSIASDYGLAPNMKSQATMYPEKSIGAYVRPWIMPSLFQIITSHHLAPMH